MRQLYLHGYEIVCDLLCLTAYFSLPELGDFLLDTSWYSLLLLWEWLNVWDFWIAISLAINVIRCTAGCSKADENSWIYWHFNCEPINHRWIRSVIRDLPVLIFQTVFGDTTSTRTYLCLSELQILFYILMEIICASILAILEKWIGALHPAGVSQHQTRRSPCCLDSVLWCLPDALKSSSLLVRSG